MWYENTRIWHQRKPRALRACQESNAYLAQKEHIWKQVDQLLLLLQVAYLEDIITVTNGVVAHIRGPATF